MLSSNGGAPFKYNPQKHFNAILKAIPKVLALNQVANKCRIPKSTFKDWIKYGDNDLVNSVDSEFATLSAAVHEARADAVADLIAEMRENEKKFRANAMLLERCFREDFGSESGVILELQETFKQIQADREAQQNK